MGLSTGDDLDFLVRPILSQEVGQRVGVAFADGFTVVQGDDLALGGIHRLQQCLHDFLDRRAGHLQFPVVQANDLPSGDLYAVDRRRADRGGDLTRLDLFYRTRHSGYVRLEIGLVVDRQECRDALRDGVTGDDGCGFIAERAGLFGSQDDIAVVGQQDHLPGR